MHGMDLEIVYVQAMQCLHMSHQRGKWWVFEASGMRQPGSNSWTDMITVQDYLPALWTELVQLFTGVLSFMHIKD